MKALPAQIEQRQGVGLALAALLIRVVKDLLEVLEQPGVAQANHLKCFMETVTGSKWSSFNDMADTLGDILLKCYTMEEQRLIACSFLGKFGVWFWRFVLSTCAAKCLS